MSSIERLLAVMAQLRHPEQGCAWDREQTWQSLTRYTIEEAYEVADAAQQGEPQALCAELGDLLLQVVFYAQIASEQGAFTFEHVVQTLVEKLVRRHPHVFATADASSPETVAANWEQIKAQERAQQGQGSALAGVAKALPALMRSQALSKRAARVGFDWPNVQGAWEKLSEELQELQIEIQRQDAEAIAAELGDVLFCCVNVARHLKVDAESALQGANGRFTARFEHIEQHALAEAGVTELSQLSAEQWEQAWQRAKHTLEKPEA